MLLLRMLTQGGIFFSYKRATTYNLEKSIYLICLTLCWLKTRGEKEVEKSEI